jgi:hypothetical protein
LNLNAGKSEAVFVPQQEEPKNRLQSFLTRFNFCKWESSPGVYVIGSGQLHAMKVLNGRKQNYGMSLARTLLHVHEAMMAAQAEKTVGTSPGYIVMRKRFHAIQWTKP